MTYLSLRIKNLKENIEKTTEIDEISKYIIFFFANLIM